MVNVTQTIKGVPWDKRTPFERWVEDDLKLDLQRGYAAGNFKHTAVKPWHERGIGASIQHAKGHLPAQAAPHHGPHFEAEKGFDRDGAY